MSVAPRASMRVHCRNLVTKLRGRTVIATATSGYSTAIGSRQLSDKAADSPYLINAEQVHGDEQEFWHAQRNFNRKDKSPMPYWDRMAHTTILMSRRAARVPQEAAFRLMAVYLKLIMMVKLVDLSSMMLPLWMSHNVQGLLGSELEKKNGDGENDKKDDAGKVDDTPTDVAAAAQSAPDAPVEVVAPAPPEAPQA
eukprot:GILI01031725.1.p1 GENE.GILI01031725.1~~GILI01031725.1.p1  ORF type:complete len:217 (+),score=32.63 GILI01031725.1:64-651(+)